AWLGNVIYRNPSRDIFVLGVTGTKGKSTVVELVNAIMEGAGKRTAIVSSVRFKIGTEERENHTGMTMPGRFFIQRFLREAVDKECQYAFVEVTSQGVAQFRDRFINFDAGILTNLQPEHIEAHGSFENYRECKINFFKNIAHLSSKYNKTFLINSDARDSEMFSRAVVGCGRTIFYNKKDIDKMKWKIKLLGDFNLENIAAAVAFARSQNIDWETIKNVIENFDGVPGRLEFVQKDPFAIVIDYAHTPDSLENVYQAIKKNISTKKNKGKMICVLGCAGGGRDSWKRPVMGEIASRYCDEIVLTDEDPFDDDPEIIVNEIAEGIIKSSYNKKFKKIMDRRDAIRDAIGMAQKNDVVIVTGKGSEPYMRLAKSRKIPWSEKDVIKNILNELKIEI
ncbi:MAG: UDP-N-acetylmuramyl-tripeptide synthetase, partial [Patescibacteria group bacterium]|nr:UDP-N-acetylmuramyl-tripeptide synthetase [Patescibacteria group bacterium]